MDEKVLKWLYDVKLAIDEIFSYFETEKKDFSTYQKNLMLKRATERNLEIIGEAINRMVKNDSTILDQITNARAIIGLRNYVIHAYDSVSDENIWSVVTYHLPKLKAEVETLIAKNI